MYIYIDNLYIYIYINTNANEYVCTYVYMYTYTCIPIHIHVQIHRYQLDLYIDTPPRASPCTEWVLHLELHERLRREPHLHLLRSPADACAVLGLLTALLKC